MPSEIERSAPGSVPHTVRPPLRWNTTWLPGATSGDPIRTTARSRPLVTVSLVQTRGDGCAPTDPYVRTFWLPIIGPGAVADLLRVAAAAQRGRPLKLPMYLPTLIREGLAHVDRTGTVRVCDRVPPLNPAQVRRLSPALRRRHRGFHRVHLRRSRDLHLHLLPERRQLSGQRASRGRSGGAVQLLVRTPC